MKHLFTLLILILGIGIMGFTPEKNYSPKKEMKAIKELTFSHEFTFTPTTEQFNHIIMAEIAFTPLKCIQPKVKTLSTDLCNVSSTWWQNGATLVHDCCYTGGTLIHCTRTVYYM